MAEAYANLPAGSSVSASGPASWAKRHPYATLVVLVYLSEWIYMLPALADSKGLISFHGPVVNVLGFLDGWGPGLAALVVTAIIQGRGGVGALLRRYLIWRVNVVWYLLALFGTAGFILGGIGLHVLLGGKAPALPIASVSPANAALAFVVFVVAGSLFNTEDLAWRGFALPNLQPGYGPLVASLLIAVPENLTHLPYFFVPGDFRQQVGLFWFMAFGVAIVILMTWMFNLTRGSVLLAVLYHASQNAWANLLDTTPRPGPNDLRPFILAVALMWVAAVVVIAATRGRLGYQKEVING